MAESITANETLHEQAQPRTPQASSPDRPSQDSPKTGSDGGSDNEQRERPVREQLKKTSIATPARHLPETAGVRSVDITEQDENGEEAAARHSLDSNATGTSRGRIRRKRSFEEIHSDQLEAESSGNLSKHVRKRSREAASHQHEGDEEHEVDSASESDADGTQSQLLKGEKSEAAESNDEIMDRPSTPSQERETALTTDAYLSPKNKRNRDQYSKDQSKEPGQEVQDNDVDATQKVESAGEPSILQSEQAGDERQTKRHRDSDSKTQEVDEKISQKVSASSGFANAAAASPFAALIADKSSTKPPATSSSAFAASGFASLASATVSPFAALGSSTAAPSLAAPASSASKDVSGGTNLNATQHAPTGFAALGNAGKSVFGQASASPFSGQASALRSFGGGGDAASAGFGGLGGAGTGLRSFASPLAPAVFGSGNKPAKPFGAPADDEEEGSGDEEKEDDHQIPKVFETDDKKDSRFFEQEVETGEEDETTLFQTRGKLYVNIEKQWRERGLGTFKLNAKNVENGDTEEESTRSARFVMRADGSHRIVLNSPLKKEMKVGDPAGGPPKGRTALFIGFIDEKPAMLQLKMRTQVLAQELYDTVQQLQRDM